MINCFETKGENLKEKNNSTNNEYNIELFFDDDELMEMDYEDAIIYDKRTYLRTYWSSLVNSQAILETFCTDNHLNLLVIKLSFFVSIFQINFFLNAFFYTDDYISDAYHNNGVLNFVSGLPKSIYSFIATLVTTYLLKMLSSSKNELMKLMKEKAKYEEYKSLINSKLVKLRNKFKIEYN